MDDSSSKVEEVGIQTPLEHLGQTRQVQPRDPPLWCAATERPLHSTGTSSVSPGSLKNFSPCPSRASTNIAFTCLISSACHDNIPLSQVNSSSVLWGRTPRVYLKLPATDAKACRRKVRETYCQAPLPQDLPSPVQLVAASVPLIWYPFNRQRAGASQNVVQNARGGRYRRL